MFDSLTSSVLSKTKNDIPFEDRNGCHCFCNLEIFRPLMRYQLGVTRYDKSSWLISQTHEVLLILFEIRVVIP